MKLIKIALVVICGSLMMPTLQAGNPDRTGQSGASELLVNPWARSVGWSWVNYASVSGLEAMRINPAGITLMEGSEVGFSHSQYPSVFDIGINALGYAQRVGNGALGLSIVSFDMGDVEVTTTSQPEGGIGTYKPQFINIGLSYSQSFTDFIHGGVVIRVVSESISDVSAQGIALDAGLLYNTGPDAYPDKFRFGVSLRNVGTPMQFSGDGLSVKLPVLEGDHQNDVYQQTEPFELPTQLNIGAAYDLYFSTAHRVTLVASFTSNSFYRDQIGFGAEYGIKVNGRERFMLRAAYRHEDGATSSTTGPIFNGLAAGFTAVLPLSRDQERPMLSVDYGFRASSRFSGGHSIGVRLNF